MKKTTPHDVLRPDAWPRPSGYSDGILATGRCIFVSGQIGWEPVTRTISSNDFAEQTRRALENVIAVLACGGAKPEHVVRMTWYVVDADEYAHARPALGKIFRSVFGGHYPAMTVLQVSKLLEPRARIEIEATAVLPG
jgi:enamine deaminase RidA (YjgF/YER057c/UK114 family)